MLFLTVALVHIIALMSPGPDFFFVSQTAISRSRREAMMGVLGITCGVMVWAGVALLGLNLILARMAWLHNIIMVGGGLYLCWMGYQMLRGALKKETVASAEPQVELARSGSFDLIILDLMMPKIDGLQACMEIRAFSTVPIIMLTAREFDLLELLMKNPNRVYSREQLLNLVWGYEYTGEYRTVDVHIRRLRKALEHSGHDRMVQTVRGTGYRFSARF